MKDLQQAIGQCAGRELEQRKHWYSPAADAYNQARPCYPRALIDRVIEIAQLSANSRILEVGCGPATATVALAKLGCSIVCLEPNPEFCRLAQQNCQPHPHVEIHNMAFEEWPLEAESYDAVLAASSFHWIPAAVGYPKAANALRQSGSLILLWNKELQPRYDVYLRLAEIYQSHAPSLSRYQDWETQTEILRELGQMAIDSGQFQDLVAGQVIADVTYTVDQYLMLLQTYSPYLELEPSCREALFAGLRQTIEQEYDSTIELSYVSAFHVSQRCTLAVSVK